MYPPWPARRFDRKASRDFDPPVRKAVKRSSPICVVTPSRRACRAAVSSTVTQRAVASPARSTSRSSASRSSSREVSSRTTWRLEISTPIPFSSAASRSVVTWPWACATSRKRRSSGPKPPTIPAGNGASTVSPAGSAPPPPPEAHHLRRQAQFAHQDVPGALEPRSRRGRGLDHHLGGDRIPVALGTPAPPRPLAALARPAAGRPFHARGPGRQPRRQPFPPRHLVPQRLVLGAQGRDRRLLRL